MIFKTMGDSKKPAVLFLHAMGVTGTSSERVAEYLQEHSYFEFGSAEEHYKYRTAVMTAYPSGRYPVFEGYDHMQYQIRDPAAFAAMLRTIVEEDRMPSPAFLK